jgi:hypothetical protein
MYRYADANTHTDCESLEQAQGFQTGQNGGRVYKIADDGEPVSTDDAFSWWVNALQTINAAEHDPEFDGVLSKELWASSQEYDEDAEEDYIVWQRVDFWHDDPGDFVEFQFRDIEEIRRAI